MESTTVLVLGSRHSRRMLASLIDAGLEPLVRTRLQEALAMLRHETFAAVVVDRETSSVDALECVLNVRDLTPETPVIVAGRAREVFEDATLAAQSGTYLIDSQFHPEKDSAERLLHVLEQIPGFRAGYRTF